MKVESKELNPCTIEMSITCDAETVTAGFEKAYKKAGKRVRVPGFRPGAAPVSMVKKNVNPEEVRRYFLNLVAVPAFEEALKESGLQPHGNPKFQITVLEEDPPKCEFLVKVPLEPKVELGDYLSLTARKPSASVSSEEVDEQIQVLRERKATRKKIEARAAELGDFAVVSIKIDGEEGEGRNFMTVVGQTFPQLDQALLGLRAEEAKNADLTFPGDFQEKDWAGKTLSCQLTLKSLYATELPELGDAFAKEFNTESLDELRSLVEERMKQAKEAWVQDYVTEQLLDGLLERSSIEVPDNLWEGVQEQRLVEIAREAEKAGSNLAEFASERNMSVEQLAHQLGEEAKLQVKRAIAIKEVFRKEGMQLSQDELLAQVEEVAKEHHMSPQAALSVMRRSGNFGEVEFRAIYRRVVDFLTEKANIVDEKSENR